MDISNKEAKMIGCIMNDIIQSDAQEISCKAIIDKYGLTHEQWEAIEILSMPFFKMRSKGSCYMQKYTYLKKGVKKVITSHKGKEFKEIRDELKHAMKFAANYAKETLEICKGRDLFNDDSRKDDKAS